MHATKALKEADRLMTVCNSCRYCEGLCAVFPAMELRRTFADGDLRYLANLCHTCGACYIDCQFSPPHAFNVDVPKVLAQVRNESYGRYAWPRALAGAFAHNGLVISLVVALSVAVFILGFVAFQKPGVLFAMHTGPGAFYRLMPHQVMALLFGAAFLYAIAAMGAGFALFWRDIGKPVRGLVRPGSLWRAVKDAARLRYLDGGGGGCFNEDDKPTASRRFYHHLTFYGFLLCFAATVIATFYHYALQREAPYPFYDLPVLAGIVGGCGLLIGPAGLLAVKLRGDPALRDETRPGMDVAFLVMLFVTGLTGLALLILRATPIMGIVLALHLGVVFGLFITMPYGKFVHGLYRFAALIRYEREKLDVGGGGG
jgi:citrate/tricarballylate utilization protein